jgi:hypothetical protein
MSLLRRGVQLFVRSQLSSVQHLEIELEGGDRQLLAGSIPGVTLFGKKAIYQGLHLSQIQVDGQNIRVNLGQVMRGKSLRLMDDVFVCADLTVEEADLNASLDSPLLDDLLCCLVHALAAYLPDGSGLEAIARSDIQSAQVRYLEDRLSLRLVFGNRGILEQVLTARACFGLESAHILALQDVQIELSSDPNQQCFTITIPEVRVPLGTDVEIEVLAIKHEALRCQGKIRVRP